MTIEVIQFFILLVNY